jgi:PAS domain-containing protein
MPHTVYSGGHVPGLSPAALDARECQIAVLGTNGNVVYANEAWSRSARSGESSAASADLGTNYLQTIQSSALLRAAQVVSGVGAVLASQVDEFSLEYQHDSESQQRSFYMSVIACDISGARHAVIAHRALSPHNSERCLAGVSARLESLFDATSHVVWSTTPDGCLGYFSSGWSKLFGLATAKLHPGDRQKWRDLWLVALAEGEPYEIDYRVQLEEEHAKWYFERGMPVCLTSTGKPDAWLVTATPLDRHKNREHTLCEMVHRRNDFFTTLLHELRNPLAPMASALQSLHPAAD